MARSNYHHGDLRNALLGAATELLASDPEALSLRRVAEAVGVSPMATYRHFANKRELIGAVALDGFAKLHKSLRRAQRKYTDDPAGMFPALGLAYARFAMRNKGHFRVMVGPEIASLDTIGDHAGARCYAVLRDAIVSGQQAGALRRDDPDQLALVGWAAIHGLSVLLVNDLVSVANCPKAGTEARVRQLMVTLLMGVGRR